MNKEIPIQYSSPESLAKEALPITGRILYLTSDFSVLRRQILGEDVEKKNNLPLLSEVSTDEIISTLACMSYTGSEGSQLGNSLLTGLRGNSIKEGDIKNGNFQVLVAGSSFAKGSSRIHAPIAFKEAGINVIIADSERIFEENCVNIGIYPVKPDSKVANEIFEGKSPLIEDILQGLSPMSQHILREGGLLPFLQAVGEGNVHPIKQVEAPRPMTIAEKIIARKIGKEEEVFVKPGSEYIVEPDLYYGYEVQSIVAIDELRKQFGEKIPVRNPSKITLHNDHTALLNDENSKMQRLKQSEFADSVGIVVYEIDRTNGAPAICHTKMIEDHVLPGQLVLGNDSHTCTLGALNALAVGKGTIDLAGAMVLDRMIIKVPESIRVNLYGELNRGVTMKDFMLQFGSRPELREGGIGSGRIFEYGGPALDDISFDEQIKLTNMSIELLGFSGVIEPNRKIYEYLEKMRGLSESRIDELIVFPDEESIYSHKFDIDLSTVEPTVSEPGDTQNGRPLSEIKDQKILIQKAYLGSCTHGTPEDLKQAAEILKGKKIAEGVKLFFQASSVKNQLVAEEKGYIKDIIDAGGELLPIGCGACMNAGPGSTEKGEIGLFATNRNFPGRTGQGKTYLASPAVVAASSIAGYILGPEDLD